MNEKAQIEVEELQAYSYPGFIVMVHPDPATYHHALDCRSDTNNTTAEIILEDILQRYSRAWKRLAEL